MSARCTGLGQAPTGIADGLRAIDCASGEMIEASFGRIFGPGGTLGTVLTVLLTLYVAFFALRLITGRGGLGISSLTPRMMVLGVAITFATSWLAYQSVVMNLALGAPDELARILIGSKGSATNLFADRLDAMFRAIADAASAAPLPGQSGHAVPVASPTQLLWVAALMLLLGTVGVLLVVKLALAAMLVVGPVFIVMALFGGTRGLFEGWLKAVVMFAVTPLFAVLLGFGTITLLGPLVDALPGDGSEVTMPLAVAIFLGAVAHVALMVMALRAATTLVSGWRLGSESGERRGDHLALSQGPAPLPAYDQMLVANASGGDAPVPNDRIRQMLSALAASDGQGGALTVSAPREHVIEQRSFNATPPDLRAPERGRAMALGRSLVGAGRVA